jgi:uncharacterized protein (DUF302 family)
MKIAQLAHAVVLVLAWSCATAADGLIVTKSDHSAKATMDRLESLLKQKGMTIFARVDHAAGAAKIGKQLRPTELLVFGNPQGGTPFIECSQTVGIDLPLKALVWQDESGQVWIGYNDPAYIAQRHGVPQCPAIEPLKKAVAGFVAEAAQPR